MLPDVDWAAAGAAGSSSAMIAAHATTLRSRVMMDPPRGETAISLNRTTETTAVMVLQ
jgi:hypothetical protein